MDNPNLLFALIVAHYIGDFPLQSDFLARLKGENDYLLFSHAVIWTGCVCAVLAYFGVFTWWKVAFLLIGHFWADRVKARKRDKDNVLTKDLWIDQIFHFWQLAVVSM